jgi:hypothetical protein
MPFFWEEDHWDVRMSVRNVDMEAMPAVLECFILET